MADITPIFDPERWCRRWAALGGSIDWQGVRAPAGIWLAEFCLTWEEDRLREMMLAIGPDHMQLVHAWARENHYRLRMEGMRSSRDA